MSPKVHAAQGALSAAILYPFIGNDALLFGLTVFFIDLDHLIPFVRDCRSLDPKRFFAYHRAVHDYDDYLALSWFHTAEFMLLLWALGFWRHEFRVMLAACLFHILFDVIKALHMGKPFLRAYSFVEYALRREGKRTRHTA
ncbi:hypothetical protein NNJEOMEG_00325 [Fundidesulfovibrio magnetotacticus]|uniref:Metal-dependent hydrolase n=1 Tax=Fundidesulfovibrio magnetotacticus TaxID=2730080 RepID=A0A6V8LNA8_9BACT|nr:hypothetical protein [Fundidesulfovibrio magnetotacticus]GFK92500.1 hypothetical protein NNJEOMEG_00325 [Fundidesulfovibrio magnetotacticus]